MRTALHTAIALTFLSTARLLAQSGVPAEDLVGWATRLVEVAQARGAVFDSLSVTVDTSATASNERAGVEIVTPGKLHTFGSVLALAAGASESSRDRERKWHIRFPVQLLTHTLAADQAHIARSVGPALQDLQTHLGGFPDCSLQQVQLHKAQSPDHLPGLERIPWSVTVIGPSPARVLELLQTMVRKHAYVALHSVKLTPAGPSILATAGGMFLTRAQSRQPGSITRVAAETAARQALEACAAPAEVFTVDSVKASAVRIQFSATANDAPSAFHGLLQLSELPGLAAFEILELRTAHGKTVLSGLLYF